MRTAILDTTVLTDLLLKQATRGQVIRECLSGFDEVLIPGYAVKELVAGPLTHFTWLHNLVASTQSLQEVFDRIHRVSRTPRRYATSGPTEAAVITSNERDFAPLCRALDRELVNPYAVRR